MAKRSREQRQAIPGYDESRPTRLERKKQHRATRHATNQILNTLEDPEEVVLPRGKRTRSDESNDSTGVPREPKKKRFKVWKTKFWKRRDEYRSRKAEMDSEWPVIPPDQLEEF